MTSRCGRALLVALIATAAGCAPSQEVKDVTRELANGEAVVDLAAVLPGPWDRAYVFGDYETADTMQSELCIIFDDAESASAFTKNDAVYVLVLIHDQSVATWMTVNAVQGSQPAVAFTSEPPFYLERADSRLRVSGGPAGSLVLDPVKPLMPGC